MKRYAVSPKIKWHDDFSRHDVEVCQKNANDSERRDIQRSMQFFGKKSTQSFSIWVKQ